MEVVHFGHIFPCLEAHLSLPIPSPSEPCPVFISFVLVNTMHLSQVHFSLHLNGPVIYKALRAPCASVDSLQYLAQQREQISAMFELPQMLLTESHGRLFSENLKLP